MPRRSRRGLRLAVGAVVVVAVGTVGGVAYARSGGPAGYRTAAVTRGTVTATLDLVGTITPVHSATVGFAQSGTVAAVDVTVGQAVSAGQTLAQLDLTALQAKLAQAQATEAAARQTLAQAESGQLPAGAGGSGSAPARSSTPVDTAAITSAQQGVVSAQKAVDQAQPAARTAVAAAGNACGASPTASANATGPTPRAGGSTTSGSSAQGTASTRGTASGGGTAPAQGTSGQGTAPAQGTASTQGGSGDCLAAEQAALTAESDLAGAQGALASAQTKLASALTKASTAAAGGGSAPATTAVSAAQLAQYQAVVDADAAAVGVAQQALDQGTAVSPLSGTVVSVGFAPGQSVAAASSTAVIAVSSPEGYEVDTVVPTSDIAALAVGQQASVTPDGATTALPATLTSIGTTATTSGFPVVLGLSSAADTLRQGASASVTLTTGHAGSTTVVPTSAVRTLGSRHVVEVLNGSTPQPALVTVGVIGATQTQVLSGLQVGQRVVLADLSSTVTSDSSTTGGARAAFGGGAARPGGGGGRGAAGGSRGGG